MPYGFQTFSNGCRKRFLNSFIQEEVYVEQPPGFGDFEKPNHVYKLQKALYGFKQASKAWYERLSKFLMEKRFSRGSVDTTLFLKKHKHDMLVAQIYVDIIFSATNQDLCEHFTKEMQNEFEMSMMGELIFFLGFPLDLDNHKNKWSRHRSFLYRCDRPPGMHVLKLVTEIPNLKQHDWSAKLIRKF